MWSGIKSSVRGGLCVLHAIFQTVWLIIYIHAHTTANNCSRSRSLITHNSIETLFKPALLGSRQSGLVETIELVLRRFDAATQAAMVADIVIR